MNNLNRDVCIQVVSFSNVLFLNLAQSSLKTTILFKAAFLFLAGDYVRSYLGGILGTHLAFVGAEGKC